MEQKAAEIIKRTIYATVATSNSKSEPWNSPVYVVYDQDLNFYWASSKTSQHSHNIRENPHVFLVIFDSSVPWGQGEGVYVQGEATEVTKPDEIAKACQLRRERAPDANQPPEDFLPDKPRSIYKTVPTTVWIRKDEKIRGYFVDERAVINLKELQQAITFEM